MKSLKTVGVKVATVVAVLLSSNSLDAQTPSGIVTKSYKVAGNCGMCKKTIETSAKNKGAESAEWNETTKVLTVKYDQRKTNADRLLRSVANAGYDNEKYTASDAAYRKLHGCCQYERQATITRSDKK